MGTVTPPWKQLIVRALQSNSDLQHSSYFQLVRSYFHIYISLLLLSVVDFVLVWFATIRSNGRASNRTVAFKGFQEGSDKILINTDTRSRKFEELHYCPFVEICWYFTDSWEQFWISGRIDVIDGSNSDPVKLQVREKSWFACSMKLRLQYLGPNPGLPCHDEQPQEFSLDPSTGPLDAFCVLILDPDQVDYVNLKINQRLMFTSGLSNNGEMLDFTENQSVTLSWCFLEYNETKNFRLLSRKV